MASDYVWVDEALHEVGRLLPLGPKCLTVMKRGPGDDVLGGCKSGV